MNMDAFLGVTFDRDKGIALIESRTVSNQATILGSSAIANLPLGKLAHSFTVLKGEHDQDLLALSISRCDDRLRAKFFYAAFIEIDWTKDQPVILGRPFVPHRDRIGQIVDGQYLEVLSPGDSTPQLYTTNPEVVPGEQNVFRYLVTDGNMLCKFMLKRVDEGNLMSVLVGRLFEVWMEGKYRDLQQLRESETKRHRDELRIAQLGGKRYQALRDLIVNRKVPLLSRRLLKFWVDWYDNPRNWGTDGQLELRAQVRDQKQAEGGEGTTT